MYLFLPSTDKNLTNKKKKNYILRFSKKYWKQLKMKQNGFRDSSMPKFYQRKYMDAEKITKEVLEYREKLNYDIGFINRIYRKKRRYWTNRVYNSPDRVEKDHIEDKEVLVDTKNILRKLKMSENEQEFNPIKDEIRSKILVEVKNMNTVEIAILETYLKDI